MCSPGSPLLGYWRSARGQLGVPDGPCLPSGATFRRPGAWVSLAVPPAFGRFDSGFPRRPDRLGSTVAAECERAVDYERAPEGFLGRLASYLGLRALRSGFLA